MTVVGAELPATRDRVFSLERRLMLRLGTLYVIALVTVSAIYLVLAWSNRHIEIADDLDRIAATVAKSVYVDADGRPRLTISPTLRAEIGRVGDLGFAVIDRDTGSNVAGSRIVKSQRDFPVTPPAGYDGDIFFHTDRGQTLYNSVRAVDGPAGHFSVEFQHGSKASTEARKWIWEELGEETLSVVLPLLGITILVTWLTLRTSVRPLRRVAEEASHITGDAAGARLRHDDVPREVLPVVNAANGALDRVERALRDQQRLMANLAHELRTPLAILRARVESVADPAVARMLLPDFERVSRLVGRLLTVARLQSEHVPFNARYELGRVVRECLAQMAPIAISQQKEVVLYAPVESIFVRGNPFALEDAVRNLVDNALRFTPPGQTVELTILPGCAVEVRDHGPGVPPEAAGHVFEPFWRGDTTGAGAGLGLAIAAETVKRHAGRVSVTNASEGGAIFRMEIPQIP